MVGFIHPCFHNLLGGGVNTHCCVGIEHGRESYGVEGLFEY
jgi:hypothetical protein